ncbi:MAG: quinone-dependent dihydroorotate dehydrogenase [Rhizobiales bacterium]|nr:quinone-dependent dihydroorotate dehydrogenase [Hyphomicrobiales bacterium]NRB14386.1 quinone-dependent dihydroorotate dehydrogenase [Hyphomicrobiales bacterium]
MRDLFKYIKPALFKLEPEQAHKAAILALKLGVAPRGSLPNHGLNQTIFGLKFDNPIGVAAGFDKNADVPNEIIKTGFGFAEIGSVTPKPQAGNPKPRIFRIPEHMGVINRMGFNNAGHDAVLENMRTARMNKQAGQFGVNIGANKNSDDFIADYESGIEVFYNVADYFVANISSPNTPGLRALQSKDSLQQLVDRICQKRAQMQLQYGKYIPLLLKIAPDLTNEDIEDIAAIVMASELDGVIVSNTTIRRDFIAGHVHENEAGGLSGKPLFEFSTHMLAKFYQATKGQVPLIGVGGISDGASAYAKICAGASLVQLYSCLIYTGTGIIDELRQGILDGLKRDSFNSIEDAIGSQANVWAQREV